jgi:hypothetical protein
VLDETKGENARMRGEIRNLKTVLNEKDREIEDLRQWIFSLEEKNKQLADSINMHFYNVATDYKDRVFNILKQSDDPRRTRKIMDIGIEPSSKRLNNLLNQEYASIKAWKYPESKYYYIPTESEQIRNQYRNRSTSPVPSKDESNFLLNIIFVAPSQYQNEETSNSKVTPEKHGSPINPYKPTTPI